MQADKDPRRTHRKGAAVTSLARLRAVKFPPRRLNVEGFLVVVELSWGNPILEF